MKKLFTFLGIITVLSPVWALSADQKKGIEDSGQRTPSVVVDRLNEETPKDKAPLTDLNDIQEKAQPEAAGIPIYQLDWISINGGGTTSGSSTSYGLGYSVGQTVAGEGTSTNYGLGIGFWFGAAACTAIPGDGNNSNSITLADIILQVNYYFNKAGWPPCGTSSTLCWVGGRVCRGDVNASGTITIADIVQLVNYFFNKPGVWDPIATDGCCLPLP
ncbi:MAG: hypothetical protein L0Y74_03530 [candidate division Zixibacteria bacterium]|nr:hypothetical protein [candidate division Zixibacteria bacterium]